MKDSRYEQLRQEAIKFHKKYPKVWSLFCEYTFERIQRGFKNYSARGIFHRIRWETDQAETSENEFKLNDHHSPFYARAFMKAYPEYSGFFRTRKQNSKEEKATDLPPLTPDYFDGVYNE